MALSRRKYGALRYGLIFAAAAAGGPQVISAAALTLAVSLPDVVVVSAGTPVSIPLQRPVFQRGIRTYGIPAQAVSTQSTTLAGGTLGVSISLPTATASPGGATVSAGTLLTTVSLPAAARVSGGVSLAAGTLSTAVSLPSAAVAGSGSALAAGTLGVSVSLPTATLASSSAAVSIPISFQRPVFQRGIRYYGPVSASTTPEANQTLTVTPLGVTVTLPTAAAQSAGDPRLPAVYARIGSVVKARPFIRASALIAAYGAVDDRVPQAVTLTSSALEISVSLPAVTVSTSGGTQPASPQLYRTRQVVKTTVQYPRTSKAKRHGYLQPPPADTAQSASAGTLVVAVSLPTATLAVGASSQAAGTLGVAVSLPPVTTSLATVRSAGTLEVSVSLPPATASPGAVTRAAGTLGVSVALPTATLQASITRTTGTLGIGVSLPAVTLTVGAAPVSATPLTVAVSLPAVRILGAITIPATIFDTTLASRLPALTLEPRLEYTLSTGLDHTVEVTS